MRRHTSTVAGSAFAIALLVMAAPSVQASPGEGADWLWGGGVHFGLPTGDFDDAVDEGWGAAGHFVATPHGRPYGLRGEVSALVYGSRDYETRQDDGYGDGGVRTDTWFGNLLIGPELRARSGVLRPYLHALAGLGYFATSTETAGHSGNGSRGDTNFDDATFAWAVGGGVEIALGSDVSLDLGARYLANGTVDYLTGEGISGGGNGRPHASSQRGQRRDLHPGRELRPLTAASRGGWQHERATGAKAAS